MKKTWPFLFYFWQYAGVAFMAPFLVLYYQNLGFSGEQIGLLTGLYPLLTLVSTPFWTGIADVTRKHRLVMSISLVGGSLMITAFPFLSGYGYVLLVVALSAIFLSPVSSLADSATMWMLADQKDKYGRLRLGGTIGFAIAAYLAGQLVQGYGLKMAFWGCACMYGMAFLTSQKFVYNTENSQAKEKTPLFQGIRILLGNRRLVLFLVGAFAGGFSMAVSNNYFFPYMKELGADATTMGLALTLGTFSEVPVMFFGNRLLRYLKAYPLFILSLVAAGLRLVLFSIAGNPTQATIFQMLNGLTFPAMWVAGVSYIDQNAPAGMSATAQGIFGATVFGVGTALGGFIGGSLLDILGARGLCLVFGVTTFVIVALVLIAGKLLPASQPKLAL